MIHKPTLALAKGMKRVTANFLVMDDEGITHMITGTESLRIRTVCDYSDRVASNVPLKLAKGAVTCLICLMGD